jgi:hypothetical protein
LEEEDQVSTPEFIRFLASSQSKKEFLAAAPTDSVLDFRPRRDRPNLDALITPTTANDNLPPSIIVTSPGT